MPSWWTSAAVTATRRRAGDDGGLGAGVVALHVGGGIGLGVAERLGLGQRVGVGRARLRHLREDVVGGAVDDAHHAGDALPHQRLAQRSDDGDAAGHRRFEEQVDPVALGGLEELGAVWASSSLLPVTTGLPALRALRMRSRGLDPADELHHQVDAGVVDDRAGVRVRRSAGRVIGRGLVRSRTGRATSRWRPVRAAMVAPGGDQRHQRAPTLPQPSTPTGPGSRPTSYVGAPNRPQRVQRRS